MFIVLLAVVSLGVLIYWKDKQMNADQRLRKLYSWRHLDWNPDHQAQAPYTETGTPHFSFGVVLVIMHR